MLIHPIQAESFAIIDQEIGHHHFHPLEYEIIRRVIHSTADFDFLNLIKFTPGSIAKAIASLQQQVPIIVDVNMVKHGINNLVKQTFNNQIICAIEQCEVAHPNQTRTETGMWQCLKAYPHAIIAIGNAPTALLAVCEYIKQQTLSHNYTSLPALVIGAPVGFVSVLESKTALATLDIPQIRIEGRKGGSPVAAAIINALLWLAMNP